MGSLGREFWRKGRDLWKKRNMLTDMKEQKAKELIKFIVKFSLEILHY